MGGQSNFRYPVNCVQCDRYLIVSDCFENYKKIFTTKGKFFKRFVRPSKRDGDILYPRACLSVNKSGHLMVCDSSTNHTTQVFDPNGKLVRSSEQKAVLQEHLSLLNL